MFKRAYAIGLLTFASFGFASLPALAQSDDSGSSPTVVNTSKQTVNQAAVIYGDRNKVRLNSNQVNITNIHNRTTGRSSTDTVDNLSKQRVNQAAVVEGNRNRVNMNADQMNVYNQRSRKSNGNHYGHYRGR